MTHGAKAALLAYALFVLGMFVAGIYAGIRIGDWIITHGGHW